MDARAFLGRRLAAQRLARRTAGAPRDLVAWLGAVQAQDYAAAKWALGVRLGATTDAAIERALDEGAILRTHTLRGTWQLVTPDDVRAQIALAAPRVAQKLATRWRELDLDAGAFRRANAALARALAAGEALTRAEIARVLSKARISPEGQRLSHLLLRAELDAVVCSGPRRGKQSTHVLLDARAPRRGAPDPDPRDAAADLARRYFRSRGPATLDDFVWWSGLTTSEARLALEAAAPGLAREDFGGATYHFDDAVAPARVRATRAHLLPAFDEWLVAYRDRTATLARAYVGRLAGGGMLDPCVVVDGAVVGTWRRTLARRGAAIAIAPFAPLDASARAAVEAAVAPYAAFLGVEASVAFARRGALRTA